MKSDLTAITGVNGACGRRTGSFLIWTAVLSAMLFCLTASAGWGQPATGQEPVSVDAAWKAEVLDSVLTLLNDNYVFPDVAEKMVAHVRKLAAEGVYDTITTPREYTEALTVHLREICRDRHLGVRYNPDLSELDKPADSLSEEQRKEQERRYIEELAYDNFGFYRVERLPGNIGYVDFRRFAPAEYGGATAVAAMNYLAHCNAIIFDLRQNGGGNPSMIQLISSYFFDESTHLNNFYYRPADSIEQFWTQAYVEGPRMSDMGMVILTSDFTFSGAEEFTYNMKNLERATIVGQTTGGGAHPVNDFPILSLKTQVRIPIGRAINPITGTNWEGTGIAPHIEASRERAYDIGYGEALKMALKRAPEGPARADITWVLESLESRINPVTVDKKLLKNYAGTYGPRKITFEDGSLYYQREDRPKYKLTPISEDTFRIEELDYFRVRFVVDEKGQPTEIIGLYAGGHTDNSPRTSK